MYRNKNDRALQKALKETFRTPINFWVELIEQYPWLFKGKVLDPSAGDGRLTLQLIKRKLGKKHVIMDIREEEMKTWEKNGLVKKLGKTNCKIGDFLLADCSFKFNSTATNPPFSLAMEITDKALSWTKPNGYVTMLQRLNWLGTIKRSKWLEKSCLKYVIVITKRPIWEIDGKEKNVADTVEYAFFVFCKGYQGRPQVRWLFFPDRKRNAKATNAKRVQKASSISKSKPEGDRKISRRKRKVAA